MTVKGAWRVWLGTQTSRGPAVLCLLTQLCPTLCSPMDCIRPVSSVCGDSPGRNTGVGCHALLQGLFPTQGSNPGLPHCRQILYCLIHQGNPKKSREVCLFDEKLINTKLPPISMAPLLSQKAVRWYLSETHSALHVPKVEAGGTITTWQLGKLRHKKLQLHKDWGCMEFWVSPSLTLGSFF